MAPPFPLSPLAPDYYRTSDSPANLAALPIHSRKSRLWAVGGYLAFVFIQATLMHRYGLNWPLSIADSAFSNLVLAAACLLIINNLAYYRPDSKSGMNIIAWILVLDLIATSASIWGLRFLFAANTSYINFVRESLPVRFCFSLLFIGCTLLVSMLYYARREQKSQAEREADAQKLAREAELNRLHQQLQPHFLFNSLNSISALIVSRPDEAMDMIYKLSDFLRGTLRKDDEQWVPFTDEIKHLQLYLDIEKVRFGHRLNTEVTYSTACEGLYVPSLVLQPLMENAIKFGLYDTTESVTISVQAKAAADMLIISISNPFDPSTSSPRYGTGFGLSGVRRRLYLLFGRNDLLETFPDKTTFTTTLKIPQA